ncbi:MAG TPA: alpha/beta hydrolase [Vitreimonas sp.]|uniref:alpha/beta fold hydrolase n=1 Tax=Vitreimonas sp. TaxID=3069702 RepID=UPI002D5CDECC|nr:alpha/beta hydrolase [Vitreimonas sp.]HYD89017.1 alpha/beta hydrolase [Vitreimonas sp.]
MFEISRKLAIASLAAFLIGGALQPAAAETFAPTRFTVEVRGEGPDVILIPGLGSSRDVWNGQIEVIAADHRVHLVQLAGFAGEPVGAPAGEVIAPFVEELAAYIEANELQRPAVIGHSMGGFSGLMLARRHPERVGRVMIVDSLPFFSAMFSPQATAANVEPQARAMRDQIAALDDASFLAQQNAGVGRLVRTPERRAEIVAWSAASNRATFAQAMYEVMTTDLRGEVASVATPLTVVYAYDPAMGPEAMIDGLYRGGYAGAANVRFVRIDGAYHFVMFDQPGAFQAAVADFLR